MATALTHAVLGPVGYAKGLLVKGITHGMTFYLPGAGVAEDDRFGKRQLLGGASHLLNPPF